MHGRRTDAPHGSLAELRARGSGSLHRCPAQTAWPAQGTLSDKSLAPRSRFAPKTYRQSSAAASWRGCGLVPTSRTAAGTPSSTVVILSDQELKQRRRYRCRDQLSRVWQVAWGTERARSPGASDHGSTCTSTASHSRLRWVHEFGPPLVVGIMRHARPLCAAGSSTRAARAEAVPGSISTAKRTRRGSRLTSCCGRDTTRDARPRLWARVPGAKCTPKGRGH